MIQPEPFASRWRRRARTIPTMLVATSVGVVSFPIVIVGAAIADLARFRFRFPSVRVAMFVVQYGLNDSAEILLAPILWLIAGFGTGLTRPRSIQRHERLQSWSIAVLARRAQRLLGIRIHVDAASMAALVPGPVIVVCRHVNIVDSSLPALLLHRLGYRTRSVVMAELLADPGFDLIYGRTGSAFIPRENGEEARARISRMGLDADATTAMVIFPEGRLFQPELRDKILSSLTKRDPERASRLTGLQHLLPPRPGGTIALIDTIPGADVVVIAHAGLDAYPTFAALARAVPLLDPIRVTAWRIAAADIPAGYAERAVWLDHQWLRVDAWVSSQAGDT